MQIKQLKNVQGLEQDILENQLKYQQQFQLEIKSIIGIIAYKKHISHLH